MATTYKQVAYDSQGNDVTELQKLLNQNGYNLKTDGIYGKNTQAAVKDYQQKNSLSVDGIAGKNTWGALTGGGGNTGSGAANTPSTGATAPSTGASDGFQYKPYTPSDNVSQAQALLQQQMAAKPGAYQSTWEGQLNEMIGKILNREEFSYDLNADALYQQYKDRYIQQGKMAMMDTMGQAQAATGGYGNSYAQSVGQQAYQSYLQGLNDVVPELYGQAYDRYAQEGQDLYNQYALLGEQEEQDYGRYQDELAAYYAELDRAQNQYNTERDYDYSLYADDRDFTYGQFADDRSYNEAVRQYNEQMAYQKDRDAVADEQWQKSYDASTSKGSGSSGSGSGSGGQTGTATGDGKISGNPPLADSFTGTTYSEAAAFMKSRGVPNGIASGVMTETEWSRRKQSSQYSGTGGPEVSNYNSYQEYLADFVEYAVEQYAGKAESTTKQTTTKTNQSSNTVKSTGNRGGGGSKFVKVMLN